MRGRKPLIALTLTITIGWLWGCDGARRVMPMPESDDPPERLQLKPGERQHSELVPLSVVERTAELHACAVWGPEVGRGGALPILDQDGTPIQYAVPFVLGHTDFPPPGKLVRKFGRIRRDLIGPGAISADFHHTSSYRTYLDEIQSDLHGFGTVYVSARTNAYPVLRVSNELHPYFFQAELALDLAAVELGGDEPRLKALRLVGPFHEYFEIEAGGRTVRFHVHTLENQKVFEDAATRHQTFHPVEPHDEATLRLRIDLVHQAWQDYTRVMSEPLMGNLPDLTLSPIPSPWPVGILRTIPYSDRMPPVLWTRWCAPTAMAMVFSYWDHYVPVPGVGTHVGYERIVDYWLDHPSNNRNVPSLLDEVVDLCSTYEEFANKRNGYAWSFGTVLGTAVNDYAWNQLVAEIDAGRPARWQIYPPDVAGHAVAVLGYRKMQHLFSTIKYVIVYNTWTTSREEWLYNHYNWSGASGTANHIELNTYIPGGKEINRAFFIRQPYGGEILQAGQQNRIRFYAQSDIQIARIEYSADGGRTWSFVVEMKVVPGWNDYHWRFPTAHTARGRIRITGYSDTRQVLATDGSFKNFQLK